MATKATNRTGGGGDEYDEFNEYFFTKGVIPSETSGRAFETYLEELEEKLKKGKTNKEKEEIWIKYHLRLVEKNITEININRKYGEGDEPKRKPLTIRQQKATSNNYKIALLKLLADRANLANSKRTFDYKPSVEVLIDSESSKRTKLTKPTKTIIKDIDYVIKETKTPLVGKSRDSIIKDLIEMQETSRYVKKKYGYRSKEFFEGLNDGELTELAREYRVSLREKKEGEAQQKAIVSAIGSTKLMNRVEQAIKYDRKKELEDLRRSIEQLNKTSKSTTIHPLTSIEAHNKINENLGDRKKLVVNYNDLEMIGFEKRFDLTTKNNIRMDDETANKEIISDLDRLIPKELVDDKHQTFENIFGANQTEKEVGKRFLEKIPIIESNRELIEKRYIAINYPDNPGHKIDFNDLTEIATMTNNQWKLKYSLPTLQKKPSEMTRKEKYEDFIHQNDFARFKRDYAIPVVVKISKKFNVSA